MDSYNFFKFLESFQRISSLPSYNLWPRDIGLNSQIWTYIKKLHNFTYNDGYEYAQSLFYADSDVVSSVPKRGYKDYVIINHTISMKYTPNNGKYLKEVFLDGKTVLKSLIDSSKIPKTHQMGLLFHVHTHPMQLYNEQKVYSFFSGQDLQSLLQGNSLSIGLITDEFWMAAKSSNKIYKISDIENQKLSMANKIYCENGDLSTYLKQSCNWGIVFYRCKFGEKLVRVN